MPDLSDVILVNRQRYPNFEHDDLIKDFREAQGVPDALAIETGEPSAEWLATNHLGPLSTQQRAAFDRDGIVLLLQHPLDQNYALSIARVAAHAVGLSYEHLDTQNVIPFRELVTDDLDSRENFNLARAERTNEIIAHLDAMDDVDRAAYFVQVFRDKIVGMQDRRVIDLFASEQPQELQAALNKAWAERRHVLQHDERTARPQPE